MLVSEEAVVFRIPTFPNLRRLENIMLYGCIYECLKVEQKSR